MLVLSKFLETRPEKHTQLRPKTTRRRDRAPKRRAPPPDGLDPRSRRRRPPGVKQCSGTMPRAATGNVKIKLLIKPATVRLLCRPPSPAGDDVAESGKLSYPRTEEGEKNASVTDPQSPSRAPRPDGDANRTPTRRGFETNCHFITVKQIHTSSARATVNTPTTMTMFLTCVT